MEQRINRHMLEGAMVHDDLSIYFYFLELPGYGMLHEYHFLEEYNNYKNFYQYCIRMRGTLLKQENVSPPVTVFPQSWYNHNKMDIDIDLKKKSIMNGFDIWAKWEQDTLQFYNDIYKEIYNSGNSLFLLSIVSMMMKEVGDEIQYIKSEQNRLKSINYDLSQIMDWQQKIKKEYFKKKEDIVNVDRFA